MSLWYFGVEGYCFQYIKNKRHKYGIKLYELCESRGLVLKIRIYSGVSFSDVNNLGQSAAVVIELLEGYLDKGHIVYTDNYYNSVKLVKKMTGRSTYICGTLRFDRKENPKDLVTKKLKRGELFWKRSDSVVICKWRDKREVLTISNMHQIEMVDCMNRNKKVTKKPNTVRDYNSGMLGIDRSDQMLSYYSSLRKTICWYKKLALHIMEVCLLNAYILYNENRTEKMKLLKFRESVTCHLLGDLVNQLRRQAPILQNQENNSFHYLVSLPPKQNKQRPTKPCRFCWKNRKRKETRYVCDVCSVKPALCIDNYFKVYHIGP